MFTCLPRRLPFVLPMLGWPKLLWFVTESKHLSKPPRDWFPHIKDANNDTAYIEVRGSDPPLYSCVCVSVCAYLFINYVVQCC